MSYLDENLETSYRIEGKPGTSNQDTKDIAKIRGGNHFNILNARQD
jgi:hypothetical protein